jgi:glycerol-3-phosphate dehydrogenase
MPVGPNLLAAVNRYFKQKLRREDVLHSFSGVRPLFDDGKGNPSAVTRDYVFDLDQSGGVPLLNVFGGKITTFRELAERGMHRLRELFPDMGPDWTETATLPGGEIADADYETFVQSLHETYPWLPRRLVQHYGRLYGARSADVLAGAASLAGLGRHFGADLYEAEARYLVGKEWAMHPDDILYRRTKHYLHLTEGQRRAFADWFLQSDLTRAA